MQYGAKHHFQSQNPTTLLIFTFPPLQEDLLIFLKCVRRIHQDAIKWINSFWETEWDCWAVFDKDKADETETECCQDPGVKAFLYPCNNLFIFTTKGCSSLFFHNFVIHSNLFRWTMDFHPGVQRFFLISFTLCSPTQGGGTVFCSNYLDLKAPCSWFHILISFPLRHKLGNKKTQASAVLEETLWKFDID